MGTTHAYDRILGEVPCGVERSVRLAIPPHYHRALCDLIVVYPVRSGAVASTSQSMNRAQLAELRDVISELLAATPETVAEASRPSRERPAAHGWDQRSADALNRSPR